MAVQPLPSTGHAPTARPERSGFHVVAWLLGAVGLFAAALGLWMVLAAEDASLNVTIPLLVDGTWTAAEIKDPWAPLLLIGGGVSAAVLFGMTSIAGFRAAAGRLLPSVELVLAMVGVVAAVIGVTTLL